MEDNSQIHLCLLLPAYCLLPSVLLISATIRLTSGGNARPFRSFSAGTARTAGGFSGTATGELPLPAAPTPNAVFCAVAALFSAALAPCFAAGFMGRTTTSSYPQRSHCQDGKTSFGSPLL